MIFKFELISLVCIFLLSAISDTTWGNIITGVVAIALAWMTMKTKTAAEAAVTASTKAVVVAAGNESKIEEVKTLATTAVKQGNSATLIQLESYEILAKQLAKKPDATQQDIDLHQRAVKAIVVHKEMQRKVDEAVKQVLADERIVAQATVAKAVQVAANEAAKNLRDCP